MSSGPPSRHSVHEIMTSVEAIMSRLSAGRAVDRALATAIAGKIHLAVNDPVRPMEVLAGNPAFETLVTAAAPSLAKTIDDPAIQLAAIRAEVDRYNPSGGTLSPAAMAALRLNALQQMRTNARLRNASEDSRSGSIASTGSTGYAALNSRWEPSSGGVGLTPANFGSTPFAGMGLDYHTTKSLFSQGFNARQIEHAASDSRALGLSPKSAAIDTAHLRKAEGKRTDKHIKTLVDYGREREELERERLREEAKPDSPEKTENLRRIEERRKALEGRTDKYENGQVRTPEGRKRFHRLREMVRDQADLRARMGGPEARAAEDAKLDTERAKKGREATAMQVKGEKTKLTEQTSREQRAAIFADALALPSKNKQASNDKPKADKELSSKMEQAIPAKPQTAASTKSKKAGPVPT